MVALGFALNKIKEDYTPVLYVILSQNYYFSRGVQMNNEAYSAYPDEGEFLLTEGCKVFVLKVEHNVKITNDMPEMHSFNGKTITIIHLYHAT